MTTGSRRLIKAATMLSVVAIVSKILGFFRETSLAAVFGAGHAADAYLVAGTLPGLIFAAFGAALTTTFIPVFTRVQVERGREAAFDSANVIVNVCGTLAIVFIVVAEVAAGPLARLVAPGFHGVTFDLTVSMSRIMLPMVLFQVMLGVYAGMLQSFGDFWVPAVVGLAYNSLVIASIVWLGPRFGIKGVAVGTLTALVVQALLQGAALWRRGYRWKPTLALSDPGLRQVGRLSMPVLITTGIGQARLVVERVLASALPEGSIASLTFASRLQGLIPGILGSAITTVMYPTLTRRASDQDWPGFVRVFDRSVRMVNLIMFPAAVGLAVLRTPIVRLVFQRGAFDDAATAATAWALLFLSMLVALSTLRVLISNALYATQDTTMPMYVSVAAVVVNIGLDVQFVASLAQGGLALGAGLSNVIAVVLLVFALRNRVRVLAGSDNLLNTRGMIDSFLRICVASGALALVVWLAYSCLESLIPGDRSLAQAVRLALAGSAGVVTYACATLLLGIPEAREVLGTLTRMVASLRRKIAPRD